MKTCPAHTRLHSLAALLLISLTALPASAASSSLKAGIAVVDITPPVGWRMCGYFYERVSTETHDPLLAKAVVFEQNRQRYALVFCDLIDIEGGLATTVRQRASKRAGVPVDHILICATHSHTGPLYSGSLRQHLHDTAAAKDGADLHERVDYPDLLAERLADVIARAARHLQPVTIETGRTELHGLAFNRRFHMKDGTVVFNPGKTNANIVRPAGPVDPSVGLVLLRDLQGYPPLASVTAFAMHCDTVGGTRFSGDYPHYLELELQRRLGSNFVSCFGNGPCGDINHINVSDPRPQGGRAEAERIGAVLGETVANALRTLQPVKPSFAAASTKVFVPLHTNTTAEIAGAREKMPLVGTRKLKFLEEVEACRILDLARWNQARRALEVQTFRLSDDTAIVGLPGEIFTDLGLAIKAASPFKNTLVIELCNDDIAYVPTRKAFAEGSYEIVNSRVAPGGGEILVETAVRLLKELKSK
jgi:neutral ceramidase